MFHTKTHALIKRIITNDFLIALAIAIMWQTILTVIGYLISRNIDPTAALLSHTFHWDAGWYQTILNDHYRTNAASAAFYPLFPTIIGFVSIISFGLIGTLAAAQIVNLIALWLALTALLKIVRHFSSPNYRFLPLLLLLSSPAAFFLHMFYSEALFIAIGFWAYALALEKRWIISCILLAALTACRLPALLFIGLCFLEFCRAYDWQLSKIFNKKLLLFFITPAGFISYGSYLALTRDNFFAMFAAYKATTDWAYQVFNFNIFETIAKAGYQVLRSFIGLRPIDHDIIVNHFIPIFCLTLLLLSSLYLIIKIKGKGIPLGIFGLLSLIMFTLNSNVVSVHRYTLACLGIYIALSLIAAKYRRMKIAFVILISCSFIIQGFLLSAFIHNNFAG
jgi:hypothetical protein